MWLARVVGSVPFKLRLAFVVIIFTALFLLSGPVIFNHIGFFLLLIFLLFFDRIVARTELKPVFVDDVLAAVSRDGDTLIVNGKRIDANLVNRVAVGRDGELGYLQFPFNPQFKVRLTYPATQVGALRLQLKRLIEDVTLVE